MLKKAADAGLDLVKDSGVFHFDEVVESIAKMKRTSNIWHEAEANKAWSSVVSFATIMCLEIES